MKRPIVLCLAVILILIGIYLSAVNMIKFTQGYTEYYTDSQPAGTDASTQVNRTEPRKIDSPETDTEALQSEKEPVLYPKRPKTGDEIGQLYIPKLDASLPIYEGTSEDELDLGVGHFADSVLPGEKDNSVLAGHRDTVFRKLGEVGLGDLLIVKTSAGKFEYKVSKVRIVKKDDRTVIVPKPSATLTVSTCYPFSYIGAAPERYILVAYLASETLY
jgi:sortase A